VIRVILFLFGVFITFSPNIVMSNDIEEERCNWLREKSSYMRVICHDMALHQVEVAIRKIDNDRYDKIWRREFEQKCMISFKEDELNFQILSKINPCLASVMSKKLIEIGGKIPSSLSDRLKYENPLPHPMCIYAASYKAISNSETEGGAAYSINLSQCELAYGHLKPEFNGKDDLAINFYPLGYIQYKKFGNIVDGASFIIYSYKEGNVGLWTGVMLIKQYLRENQKILTIRKMAGGGFDCANTFVDVKRKGNKILIEHNFTNDEFLEYFVGIEIQASWSFGGSMMCFGTYVKTYDQKGNILSVSDVSIPRFSQEYIDELYDSDIKKYVENYPEALDDFTQCYDYMRFIHKMEGELSLRQIQKFADNLKKTCKGYENSHEDNILKYMK